MKQILLLTILALTLSLASFGRENAASSTNDYKIDEYGKIPWIKESERLQNILLFELSKRLASIAYLIFHLTKNSELKLVKSRQKKILKFFQDILGNVSI